MSKVNYFEEGQKARRAGKPKTANPCRTGTMQYFRWYQGWTHGAIVAPPVSVPEPAHVKERG